MAKRDRSEAEAQMLNDETYIDYMSRLKKIATSIFEWVNLPSSMNERAIEEWLFYKGQCAFLKHETMGYLNLKASSAGTLNIYGLPTTINCYSYDFNENRQLYSGLNSNQSEDEGCILVMNNWDRVPTFTTLRLFAYRLYEAQRSADVNIKNQKFPYFILTDNNQRFSMKQVFQKIDGNEPVIFGDKNNLTANNIQAIPTLAPFVADKLDDYKNRIFGEALSYLGINNVGMEKKERLITTEADSNNEFINMNLQSFLIPRKEACKQFNEKFGLTGDKAIDVRVRSDLHNIIKNEQSSVASFGGSDE